MPFQVDDLRAVAAPGFHLLSGAHGDDALSPDGYGLGPGTLVVHRVDAAMGQDQVGFFLGFVLAAAKNQGTQGEQQTQSKIHSG